MFVKRPYRTWRAQELVNLANKSPRAFEAGSKWEYSNTNYILLGMVIEKVTGRPFTAEINDRIVKRLKLSATTMPSSSTTIKGPHARGYHMVKGKLQDVTRMNPTVAGAAGGIISTTTDLNAFFRALLGGKLLRPAELALMKTPVIAGGSGLGLTIVPSPCGTANGHDGTSLGYYTASLHNTDGTRQVSATITMINRASVAALDPLLRQGLCG